MNVLQLNERIVVRCGKRMVLARVKGMWSCTCDGVTHLAPTANDAIEGWFELYGPGGAA